MHPTKKTSLGEVIAAWRQYGASPQASKDRASFRLSVLREVGMLLRDGTPLMTARELVAGQHKHGNIPAGGRTISPGSIAHWQATVAGQHPQDWLAFLIPNYVGRTSLAWVDADLWMRFKTDFLRPECPSAASCYERLRRAAIASGRPVPSLKTLQRRLDEEMPNWRQARRSGARLTQLGLF